MGLRSRTVIVATLTFATACVGDAPQPAASDGGIGDVTALQDVKADTSAEASAPCDLTKAFGPPTQLAGIGSSDSTEDSPSLTGDELSLYFDQQIGDGGTPRISVAKRASRQDPFGPAAVVSSISGFQDGAPWISADGLDLYFFSQNRPGVGGWDLWLVHREQVAVAFGAPALVANVNSGTLLDFIPSVTSQRTRLYWQRADFGGKNHQMVFSDMQAGEPSAVIGDLTYLQLPAYTNDNPRIAPNDLAIFFESNRPGGKGGADIWMATRTSPSEKFGAPFAVTEINSSGDEGAASLSPDGCRVYFHSSRSGVSRLYTASRP